MSGEVANTENRIAIFTDDTDLAVELARVAAQLQMSIAPECVTDPWSCASQGSILTLAAPTTSQLLEAARAFRQASRPPLVGWIAQDGDAMRGLAQDLGLIELDETRPFLAALAMLETPGVTPWTAQSRGLSRAARARLERAGWTVERGGGRLSMLDDGIIAWQLDTNAARRLGEAVDVANAGRAHRSAASGALPGTASVDGVDATKVREVLFGPRRVLSDPASKAALAPYGMGLPFEELCTSPSRAAMEATRIGYPVKVSVASPDLRIWDHPDLVVPSALNAAAVREAFRVLMTMATERDPAARLLGVHVTADAAASALLHVDVRPALDDWAIATIARDAHSQATVVALPTTTERIRRALQRARITTLKDRTSLDALADALNRICAFVVDHRDAVVAVRIDPLGVLVGGGTECRETAVTIGDVFERSLAR